MRLVDIAEINYMIRVIHLVLFFLVFTIISNPVYSVDRSIFTQTKKGHYITKGRNGSYIDWTAGYLCASSTIKLPRIIFNPEHPDFKSSDTSLSITDARTSSRSMAREQAELQLMDLILSTHLDSDKTIRNKMEEDISFRDRMGYLSTKFIVKSEKSGNGVVSMELAIPFIGEDGLYSVLTGNDYNTESIPEFHTSIIKQEITGIIIDLSEFKNFQSTLEPRIFTDQGRLIYGPETLNPEIVIKRGLASYHINHNKAVSDFRAGFVPYYLHATSVQKGNIYLASEEVKRILSSPSGKSALHMGKIVLILPP